MTRRSSSEVDDERSLRAHVTSTSEPVAVVDTSLRAAVAAAAGLRAIWSELCLSDPPLPEGAEPPMADTVIATLTDAFVRPQPVDRIDLALEPVMQAFATEVDSVDGALAMLGCLRTAWARAGVEGPTVREHEGISYRMNMIIDRMMVAAAKTAVLRLTEQALSDPLTGLGNRRAFDQTLERETARALRHDRPITVAIIDLDGLKRVNDTQGHAAGDASLTALADALRRVIRAEDAVYRLGGDEFAVILPDAVRVEDQSLEDRIRAAGAPPFSLGLAATPRDDIAQLTELADARLYERRYRRRYRRR